MSAMTELSGHDLDRISGGTFLRVVPPCELVKMIINGHRCLPFAPDLVCHPKLSNGAT